MHRLGERGCIYCRKAPTIGEINFCNLCHNKTLLTAPMVVEVPNDHNRYKDGQSIEGDSVVFDEPADVYFQLHHNSNKNGCTRSHALKSVQSTRS